MAEIRRYVLVDNHGCESSYEYRDYDDAQIQAAKRNCAVIARIYRYEDSELLWTPDGGSTWPPEDGELR